MDERVALMSKVLVLLVLTWQGCAADAGLWKNLKPEDRDECKPGATVPAARTDTIKQLKALRDEMAKSVDGIKGYIVPSGDAHQTEYVSAYDKRLGFITGFTGSAGTAAILPTKAAMRTDSRYYIQASEQMDCKWILLKMQGGFPSIPAWIAANLNAGDKVAIDPRLVSVDGYQRYAKDLAASSITLVPLMTNLIDTIWTQERPKIKQSHLLILDLKFAGKPWQDKLNDVRKEMERNKAEAMVLSALDDIAWLYNLRGSDIPYTPLFMSYSIITKTNATLYIQDRAYKETAELKRHLTSGSETIEILDYDNMFTDLAELNDDAAIKKIWVGKKKSSYAIWQAVKVEKKFVAYLPVVYMKTIKNDIERAGMRRAHLKDAVAKVDFFAHLEKSVQAGDPWTELSAAAKIKEFRSEQENFVESSFATISAVGPNAAKPHYVPSNSSNRKITLDEIYLLDSGGQYFDGTTDVTRTVHFGTPTEYQREMYTRVLMGAIDLARWVWRKNAYGYNFAASAHSALWAVGLDYFHGTGHGIGMFLNIHEDPAYFALWYTEYNQKFQEGMFFSDEPGYYKEGEFGIRLETIVEVMEAKTKYSNGFKFLRFEPISYVPFEPNLINLSLMTREQKIWLNDFHKKCETIVGAELKRQGRTAGYEWLSKRTKEVSTLYTSGSNNLFSNTYLMLTVFAMVIFC